MKGGGAYARGGGVIAGFYGIIPVFNFGCIEETLTYNIILATYNIM